MFWLFVCISYQNRCLLAYGLYPAPETALPVLLFSATWLPEPVVVVPLLRTMTKPRSNRIDALRKQIKWIEDHSHGNNAKADANIKELKAELELLEEEAKADALRRLPLYSCRITG